MKASDQPDPMEMVELTMGHDRPSPNEPDLVIGPGMSAEQIESSLRSLLGPDPDFPAQIQLGIPSGDLTPEDIEKILDMLKAIPGVTVQLSRSVSRAVSNS